MRTSSTKNSLIIGLSIVLSASILSVGVGNAAGASIKACAKKSNGAMRFIDTNKKCKKSERTLTWGINGTAGAKGATGARGANGVSTVLVKKLEVSTVGVESPEAVLSAEVPKGKYSFQFSSELLYFNNNVDTLKERSLACLITTNFDGPTAFSDSTPYKDMVLWPIVGSNIPMRTSFPPAEANEERYGNRAHVFSGTLDITSDSDVYLQCMHEQQIGDSASAGQEAVFFFPTLTLVKTNEIVNMD